jgi:hypothetical protein
MIKHADLQDFGAIMDMMERFANASSVPALHNPEYDVRRIQHLLFTIKNAGCIIIGYQDEQPAGMLIARIMEDAWLPHVRTLKEMAWWVEPEYRGGTVGYRLLKEYVKTGEAMKESGVIENFTLTLMTESPDFDLEKRGWRSVETNYVYEGKN